MSKYLYTFLVILIMIFSVNITLSRYARQATVEKDIVAVPVLNLSNNTLEYEITDMLPGDSKEYVFTVSNVENGQQNEVLLKYYFEVNFQTDIPINIYLYNIMSDGTEQEVTISNQKTDEVELAYETEITKEYKLKIDWNANDNSYTYAGNEIVGSINLIAVQVVD